MRLIDSDAMKEMISAVIKKQNGKDNDLVPIKELNIFIDEQPTAYDVDKVVEELEHTMSNDVLPGEIIWNNALKMAIEIVKQGGIRKDVSK